MRKHDFLDQDEQSFHMQFVGSKNGAGIDCSASSVVPSCTDVGLQLITVFVPSVGPDASAMVSRSNIGCDACSHAVRASFCASLNLC